MTLRTAEIGAIAEHHSERDDVALDGGEAADIGVVPDAGELVDARAARDRREVADDAMTCQHDVVDQRHVVADHAVMRDVSAREEGAVVADACLGQTLDRAWVHRHMLADQAVLADHETRILAHVLEVLRLVPDRGEGMDARALPDRRVAGENHVRLQPRASPEDHVRTDRAERTDLAALADLRSVLDDRGRMDGVRTAHFASPGTSIALIVASATFEPLTIPAQSNFQMLPRFFVWVT